MTNRIFNIVNTNKINKELQEMIQTCDNTTINLTFEHFLSFFSPNIF